MNIDLLANNPSVKWYFIVAAPFLVLCVALLLLMRVLAARKARNEA